MTDARWQLCAGRILREPLGDGLVGIRLTATLTEAVRPDDECARASARRDGSFYAAVRTAAVDRLPFMLVGNDGSPPLIQSPVGDEQRAGTVFVKLAPHVEDLGCHPVAEPSWGRLTRADVPVPVPPATMYWVSETALPVRFVRDEYVGYDSCHIVKALSELEQLLERVPFSSGVREDLERALVSVDFRSTMVVIANTGRFDRGPIECDQDPSHAPGGAEARVTRDRRGYVPWCTVTIRGLEVGMWRDVNPPCIGSDPGPATRGRSSSWQPDIDTPLVLTPRREGSVFRTTVDEEEAPPCS